MPEIIIVKNEAEAGEIYGRCVADLIKAKPDAVLGLATGSSPLAAYQALAKIVKDEAIDVSGVRGFALDEYIGLPLTHPESYHATIHRTVVEPLGLDPAKVHVPGDVLNGTPLEDGDKVALAGPAYRSCHRSRWRHRRADPRHRHRRPRRLQRARFLVGLRHSRQDLGRTDPHRQRALLRQRHQPSAHPLHHAGYWHD